MAQNIWFALPSLTVMLIQVWIFIRSDKRALLKQNKALALLFIGLLVICSIEFLTYSHFIAPSLMAMKLFYVSCFTGLAGFFLQALKVSGIPEKIIKYAIIATALSFFMLSTFMIGTNLLVTGYEYISYSYTRIPGQLYAFVQIYLLILSILSITVLFFGTRSSIETDARRSKLLLVAISPLLFFAIALVSIMQFGVQINASITFPLFIAYFLLLVLQTEKDESLFSLLIKLPFSKERESLNQITNEIRDFLIETELSRGDNKNNLSLKSLTNSIENIIVEHAVKLNNGSQIKAAALLGVSSSSICRKKNKH